MREKRALRRELFARVRALTPEERALRSSAIRRLLGANEAFQEARCVFSFLALPGEPDLTPLAAASSGKRWAFPRVNDEERLTFHETKGLEEVRAGSHGILEPDPSRHPITGGTEAQLILVPGVGFDPRTGTRLGRGRGHYDRFLAETLAANPRVLLVGVAFAVQLTDLVPEPHDIPVHRVLTEAGWS